MTTASSTFAAAGGVGTLQMAAGSGPSAYLQGVSALSVDLISTLGCDKAPTGGGTFTSAVVRRIGTSDYRVKVRATASGTVLDLVRTVSGGETVLATQALTGVLLTAGETFQPRLQAQGSGTTTLQAKFWESGTSEPGWTLTSTARPRPCRTRVEWASTATCPLRRPTPITLRVYDLQATQLG